MIKKGCKLTYVFVWLALVSYGQKAVNIIGNTNMVSTMQMPGFSRDTLSVFGVDNGAAVEINKTAIGKDKKFKLSFFPKYEGLYVIGVGKNFALNENYIFYFKPGDQINLTLLDTAYVLNGSQNSEENLVMKQWFDLTNPLYQKAINFYKTNSTYEDYFPMQEEIVKASKNFLQGKQTKNPKFNEAIKNVMKMDLAYYATNFLFTPRSVHPKASQYSPFYSTLSPQEYAKNTDLVYNYPYGKKVIFNIVNIKSMYIDGKKYTSNRADNLQISLPYVPNDTLKGDFVIKEMANSKSENEYAALKNLFGKYLLSKTQKKEDKKIAEKFNTTQY